MTENEKLVNEYRGVKYKICVSGTADTAHVGEDAFKLATELGAEIVRQGGALIDGATTGFPYWAAKGAKEAGGIVVGFSPAVDEKDHLTRYKLPIDFHDLIIYTGFNYSGRNLLLTRSSDAVVFGAGRMGTINEFTIAFEDQKPMGILEGSWETDELMKEIIEKSHRAAEMKDKIVYSSNPKELIEKLIKVIDKYKGDSHFVL